MRYLRIKSGKVIKWLTRSGSMSQTRSATNCSRPKSEFKFIAAGNDRSEFSRELALGELTEFGWSSREI